jgi:hypothetical protein
MTMDLQGIDAALLLDVVDASLNLDELAQYVASNSEICQTFLG